MENQPIPSPYQAFFHSIKVVAFMEVSPASDKFQQIVLSQENVIKLLNFLETCMEHNGPSFRVVCNDKWTIELPNIKDNYSPEEIKLLDNEEENGKI